MKKGKGTVIKSTGSQYLVKIADERIIPCSIKGKFRIKGMDYHSFYPLFLEQGKTHQLKIDLNRFYSHDKSIKKFPKTKIYLKDVKGKKLGSKAVFLRKTLVKF